MTVLILNIISLMIMIALASYHEWWGLVMFLVGGFLALFTDKVK